MSKINYVEQYKKLHEEDVNYGKSSERFKVFLKEIVRFEDIKTCIDFGCGKSRLVEWLARYVEGSFEKYDPSICGCDELSPEKVDLLINTDVLEHIPESSLAGVLKQMRSKADKAFFSISTVPAKTFLPSGENAHCTVYPASWWKEKLSEHYDFVLELPSSRPTNCFFVTWKPKKLIRLRMIFAKIKYKLKFGY